MEEALLSEHVSTQIAGLAGLNKQQLSSLWREEFGKEIPPHLRKPLIVSVLCYRIQEKEFGGLSHAARKRLREIAASLAHSKRARVRADPAIEVGSRLVRSWHGEVHEVNVTEAGFEYRGKSYRTLSKIAREITGTQWSGPLFFGTRKKTP